MYGPEEVRRVQRRLLEMAVAVRDILERNDIPYFIAYGSLLGAVRHKGFIPWDDDFDFYLFDDTYDRAMTLLRRELPELMLLEDAESEPRYFHGWAHVKDLGTRVHCQLYPQDECYAHKGIFLDLYRTRLIDEEEEPLYRVERHLEYLERRHNAGLLGDEIYRDRVDRLTLEKQRLAEELSSRPRSGKQLYAFVSTVKDWLYPEEAFPLQRMQFEGEQFWGPREADTLLRRIYGDYMQLPPVEKRIPHYSEVTFLK